MFICFCFYCFLIQRGKVMKHAYKNFIIFYCNIYQSQRQTGLANFSQVWLYIKVNDKPNIFTSMIVHQSQRHIRLVIFCEHSLIIFLQTQLLLSESVHYSSVKSNQSNKMSNGFSTSGVSSGKYRGILSFHNIQYKVQVSTGMCKSKEKVILDDIRWGDYQNVMMFL